MTSMQNSLIEFREYNSLWLTLQIQIISDKKYFNNEPMTSPTWLEAQDGEL